MTELILKGLTKEYETGSTAVSDINLTVASGELMVLLGPSGCGKTTTLRLIAGLLSPTSGDILFDGRSILNTPPEKREAVMVFQEDALFPFMTVGENVAFGLKMRHVGQIEIEERVKTALEAVQLTGFTARMPAQLSGGQKQRVALARALVVRPRILLLDEPLSHLDQSLREELRQMIGELQQQFGLTTLFVTHDQIEAAALADRIGVMIDGRLRQVDQPRAFFEQPADAQIARFFGGVNFLQGIKQGVIVETALGMVQIGEVAQGEGAVVLTIRPEAIEMVADQGVPNTFGARVVSCAIDSLTPICHILVGDTPLQMVLRPYQLVAAGAEIWVHFPPERIIVLSN